MTSRHARKQDDMGFNVSEGEPQLTYMIPITLITDFVFDAAGLRRWVTQCWSGSRGC
jgi:hypothetical protein